MPKVLVIPPNLSPRFRSGRQEPCTRISCFPCPPGNTMQAHGLQGCLREHMTLAFYLAAAGGRRIGEDPHPDGSGLPP